MPSRPAAPRSSAPRGPRAPSWRKRSVARIAISAVAAIIATEAIPAFAHPLAPDRMAGVREELSSSAPAEQTYTVPLSVELPSPVRAVEMTAVAPKRPRWVRPVSGELRDGFGPRPVGPVAGLSAVHHGQDIGAPCGATIRAAAAGRVVEAGPSGTYGNWIVIDHGHGLRTGYAHASRLLVAAGRHVAAGTPIAEVGSTGASSGCHLHLEIHRRDRPLEPVGFLHDRGVRLGS